MNEHFEDARYYLGRAAEHAAEGLREELTPVEERVRELVGDGEEPDRARVRKIQSELRDLERRAQGKSKEAIASAREQLEQYRSGGGTEVDVESDEGDEANGDDGGSEPGREAESAN